MNAARAWQSLSTLIAAGVIWAITTPAHAQAAGCACPAGFTPATATTCINNVLVVVPAICPGRNVGHIAASQQQLSFWGVNQVLQAKRDQLQRAPSSAASTPKISGYSSSIFDDDTGAPAYSDRSKKNNPLASHLYDAAPSASPANPNWGAWVQGLGDWEHDDALSANDVAHFTSTYTVQSGFDRTQQGVLAGDDALVVGIVGSWTNTHTGFANSPITMKLNGPGIGVYSEYVRGGFSTDLTGKFDFLQLNQDLAGLAPNVSISILNAGVSGNVQYKVMGILGRDSSFIEPTAGFSLTHISFGNGAAAFFLEDAYTLRLQAGARLGTNWDVGHGVTIDASLKALVYGDAVAQGTSFVGATAFGTPVISPVDEGLARGELDPELAFNLPNDYSVTVSGQFRFGRAVEGGSAGLNLRKQW
jgi:hypothetical protein